MLPFNLHVLSLPPAFILSQDQTLHCILFFRESPHYSCLFCLSWVSILVISSNEYYRDICCFFFNIFQRTFEPPPPCDTSAKRSDCKGIIFFFTPTSLYNFFFTFFTLFYYLLNLQLDIFYLSHHFMPFYHYFYRLFPLFYRFFYPPPTLLSSVFGMLFPYIAEILTRFLSFFFARQLLFFFSYINIYV